MNISLKNQVALVTGGTRGIGAAISETLASCGAVVAANYRTDEKTAKAFAKKMARKNLPVFLVAGDVGDPLQAEQIVHEVISRKGRLDILVNNAGIWRNLPLNDPKADAKWDMTMNTNLKGTYQVCVQALPHLTKSKSGRIINISSTAGQRGESGYAHYAASKGGIIALTKSLAIELAQQQILVNCVAPGWVHTDMTTSTLEKPSKRRQILKEIPLGKVAQPEDIAGAVLFLASSLATHITGEVINVNGGAVLQG